ncbi:hypothetical protein ASD07_13490 [Duganella sp. Root336D2]|nr:hypothetical protein ASD07_13490 [Duganella sp. Root336D2]
MSRIMKLASACSLLIISFPAWAGGVICEAPYFRPGDGGPDSELCAIQAAAKRFLDQQNIKNKTDWKPLGPDIRMMFDPCLVPLGATWAMHEARKSVMVSCDRTVASAYERKWTVAVAVSGESVQLNYHIHKAAGAFVLREQTRSKLRWKAGYPSDETMVPKCVVPFAVEWRGGPMNSVDVICRKAIQTTWGKWNWRVRVPVEPSPAP